MFYALETYCENLEEALDPHLPVLMERLFEALSPENSVHLRDLSLSCIASAAKAAKSKMLPYFERIINILKMYLVRSENEDIIEIRPQAIDTLAALARTIGKENFLPLTNDTMTFGLTLLEDSSEPELRSSNNQTKSSLVKYVFSMPSIMFPGLYNLFAALAEVVNAEMAPVMPKIVERMLDTIKSTDDLLPEFKEDDVVAVFDKNDENDVNEDIDIENTDDEDDDDDEYAGQALILILLLLL